MPRLPPNPSIQLKGLSGQEPVITGDDLPKGLGDGIQVLNISGQLSSGLQARKKVHKADGCGEDAPPAHLWSRKSGATKTAAETETACLLLCMH
jgi:hypothetical protein